MSLVYILAVESLSLVYISAVESLSLVYISAVKSPIDLYKIGLLLLRAQSRSIKGT